MRVPIVKNVKADNFLKETATGDENWIHFSNPETKQVSVV